MQNSLLKLANVTYQPNNLITPIINNIDLQINSGEFVVITGITGAGKTTLLRLINTLNPLTKGTISYQNQNYQQLNPIQLRQQINLVPQEPKLLGLNTQETIAYPLKLQKISPEIINQKILNITNLLNIPTDWLTKQEYQLSQGQKHLITIARSLILEPKILLLDEPIASLDLVTATQLLTTLKKLTTDHNLTLIIVTHQLHLISQFTSHLIYLKQGKKIIDQTQENINWSSIEAQLQTDINQENSEWE
jgi:D-methionine transport system ATP-binding protein